MSSQQTGHQKRHQSSTGSRGMSAANHFTADNHYTLLNVPYNATRHQITRAYRQAMMRSHPDRVLPEHRAAAEDLSKQLNIAYSTLSDPRKRQHYDRVIRADVMQRDIMNRYVGGFGVGGPGSLITPPAHAPRRSMSPAERRDQVRSDRSAMLSLFSVFTVVALGAIGLLLILAVVSMVVSTLS